MGERPEDLLHHGEVLPVVVGLEQREPEVQLEGDAANAPNVAGLTPAKLQDHFGSPDEVIQKYKHKLDLAFNNVKPKEKSFVFD